MAKSGARDCPGAALFHIQLGVDEENALVEGIGDVEVAAAVEGHATGISKHRRRRRCNQIHLFPPPW